MRLGLARLGIRVVAIDGAGAARRWPTAWPGRPPHWSSSIRPWPSAYAGVMGRLARYPSVWWNGPGADFASLDLALAEQA